MFEEKGLVKGSPAASPVPQKTIKPQVEREKPKKTTPQAFRSTSTSSTARPAVPTRLPEFVHMPTVKFDFGSSSFQSKGSTKRTETGETKERIKESHKEKIRESVNWPTGNDILEKDSAKKKEKVRNKIGSRPALGRYSSKARFNDKDNSMFPRVASNR